MKELAKSVAANLKWTKKVKGEEFVDLWLNDENVKYYRSLMWQIWNYEPERYVIATKTVCNRCKKEKDKYFNLELSFASGRHWEEKMYCQDCCIRAIDIWNPESYKYSEYKL